MIRGDWGWLDLLSRIGSLTLACTEWGNIINYIILKSPILLPNHHASGC